MLDTNTDRPFSDEEWWDLDAYECYQSLEECCEVHEYKLCVNCPKRKDWYKDKEPTIPQENTTS